MDRTDNSIIAQIEEQLQLTEIEYQPNQHSGCLNKAILQFNTIKDGISNLSIILSGQIRNNFQGITLVSAKQKIEKVLQECSSLVCTDYNRLLHIKANFQGYKDAIQVDDALIGLEGSIKKCFQQLHQRVKHLTAGNMPSKVVFDMTALFESPREKSQLNDVLYFSKLDLEAASERNGFPEPEMSEKEVDDLFERFQYTIWNRYEKEMDRMSKKIASISEDFYQKFIDDVDLQIKNVIVRLKALGKGEETDRNEEKINEFFLKDYTEEITLLRTKLKGLLDRQNSKVIEDLISAHIHAQFDSQKGKLIGLTEYLWAGSLEKMTQMISGQLLSIIKTSKIKSKFCVLEAESRPDLLQKHKKRIVKINSLHLVRVANEKLKDSGVMYDKKESNEQETILYCPSELMPQYQEKVHVNLSFFPSDVQIPSNEELIIYFMLKLAEYYEGRMKGSMLKNCHKELHFEISLEEFTSFALLFLTKNSVNAASNGIEHNHFLKQSNIVGNEDGDYAFSSPKKKVSKSVRDDESVSYNTQEETKLHEEKIKSLNDFDNMQFLDLNQNDADWKESDLQIFEQIIKQTDFNLLNDFKTFKQFSDQDYILVDKSDSFEIFKQHSVKSHDLFDLLYQKVIAPYLPRASKGVVFLLPPLPQIFNLVILKIDFEAKVVRIFVLHNENINFSALTALIDDFLNILEGAFISHKDRGLKLSKFKHGQTLFKIEAHQHIEKAFQNFYFPYFDILTESLDPDKVISTTVLQKSLHRFIKLCFRSSYGLDQIRNLLQVYQVHINKFTNLLIMEDFWDFDHLDEKIKHYLSLCFVDNLEAGAEKIRGVLLIGHVYSGKLDSYDSLVVYFEYINNQTLINDPNALKNSGDAANLNHVSRMNLHVFGDTHLHVSQVKTIVKSFFEGCEQALKRVNFYFYEMKRLKSKKNLLFMDKTLVYCLVSVLLNENLPIQDILSICRLSPTIQYEYFSLTMEKIRAEKNDLKLTSTHSQSDEITAFKPLKMEIPPGERLLDEALNIIQMLDLAKPGVFEWIVGLHKVAGKKRVVTQMVFEKKDDPSFKINMQELESYTEPYTLILINPSFDSNNNNLCNIIEPDGSVYILKVASQELKEVQVNSKLQKISNSIEQIQKNIPKLKNYNISIKCQTIYLKKISIEEIVPFLDFVQLFYVQTYASAKDPWLVLSENTILSLLLSDTRIYLKKAKKSLKMVEKLRSNRFLLVGDTLIERPHKHYHEESLIGLSVLMNMSRITKSLIFCIRNQAEYSFHLVAKRKSTNSLLIIVLSIKEASSGNTGIGFYQDILAQLGGGVFAQGIRAEYQKIDLSNLPTYFHSISPEILEIALADALKLFKDPDLVSSFRGYLQTWYRPTVLTDQFICLGKYLSLKT